MFTTCTVARRYFDKLRTRISIPSQHSHKTRVSRNPYKLALFHEDADTWRQRDYCWQIPTSGRINTTPIRAYCVFHEDADTWRQRDYCWQIPTSERINTTPIRAYCVTVQTKISFYKQFCPMKLEFLTSQLGLKIELSKCKGCKQHF
jgi:hypothetical protein